MGWAERAALVLARFTLGGRGCGDFARGCCGRAVLMRGASTGVALLAAPRGLSVAFSNKQPP
jgi:hypothetical protein